MTKPLTLAIEAAINAGSEIMKIYSGHFDVELKRDNSPLTMADEKANVIINSFLKTSDIPIISEENKQIPYSTRKNWHTCWMVDPLDGTKEFIKKNDEFTVNIALIKNNKPILGVIYVPASKILYYALVSEKKAFKIVLNTHEFSEVIFQNKREIKSSNKVKNQIKVIGSRSHKSEATNTFIKQLEAQGKDIELVTKGSSLKFCLMAEGEAHIYPRFAPTMEWDTAAGHAICNAVGLQVMEVNKNASLVYNKEDLLNPFFIVQ